MDLPSFLFFLEYPQPPERSWHNAAMQPISLGLLFLEEDSRTQHASACISMKPSGATDFAGIDGSWLITKHCMSFIELDAELRRLHAELDEIRAQAKKKFYKTEAAIGAAAGK